MTTVQSNLFSGTQSRVCEKHHYADAAKESRQSADARAQRDNALDAETNLLHVALRRPQLSCNLFTRVVHPGARRIALLSSRLGLSLPLPFSDRTLYET